MYKDNKNENMKRKTSPKNSTKRGFPVILPQALQRPKKAQQASNPT
jgi:hypothetical protein